MTEDAGEPGHEAQKLLARKGARMRAGLVAVASLCVACGGGGESPHCGTEGKCPAGWACIDGIHCAKSDLEVDAPDAETRCWVATNLDPCDSQLPPPMPLVLSSGTYLYDTATGVLTGSQRPLSLPSALLMQPGG